jgi:predicted DNA-binding transcriptional regulator AlpA
MFDANQLYDQTEVAKALGKSEAWAERSRWDGSGPAFIKVGRSVRYRGSDLLAWIESRVCASTADRGRA